MSSVGQIYMLSFKFNILIGNTSNSVHRVCPFFGVIKSTLVQLQPPRDKSAYSGQADCQRNTQQQRQCSSSVVAGMDVAMVGF